MADETEKRRGLLQSIKDALTGKSKQSPWTVVEKDDLVAPGVPDPNLPIVAHRQHSPSRKSDPGPMPGAPLKTWTYEPPPKPEPPFDNALDLLDAAAVPPLMQVDANGDVWPALSQSMVESFKTSPRKHVVHTRKMRWHGSSQGNRQSVGITLHHTAVRRKS